MPNFYPFKDFEGSSHRILIRLVRRHVQRGGTLLDLGAAGGELAHSLSDHFDRRIGFEYNSSCCPELRERLDQVVIADLDSVPRLPSNAAAIVMADVLEHLYDPAATLRLVRNAVAEDGRVFLSVPNVANVTVRLALLTGRFEYQDRGILDRTHIRFYTPQSFCRLVESAGFQIIEKTSSTMPIRLVLRGVVPEPILRAGERLLSVVTKLWPSMFGYQTIVVAKKR